MKILAVSGSLRKQSASMNLLRAIADGAGSLASILLYSELELIPPFNPDNDDQTAPDVVVRWRSQLKDADAVIFSTPEYAHGIPGVLKNALDWVVGSGELYEKRAAIVQPSPRGEFALKSLSETLEIMGVKLAPAMVIDPSINAKDLQPRLSELLASLGQ